MKIIKGDAWEVYAKGNYTFLGITTNGFVRKDGACVMGRGIAATAKQKYPRLPYTIGSHILKHGNIVGKWYNPTKNINILSFPVKHNWYDMADINLIIKSCKQLMEILGPDETVLLPRPGCGNGKLDWMEVQKIITPLLDDRVTIISW